MPMHPSVMHTAHVTCTRWPPPKCMYVKKEPELQIKFYGHAFHLTRFCTNKFWYFFKRGYKIWLIH
jgi:hypothetical protein